MSAKGEIEKLRAELERHNRLYYLATPEISDYDFDQLMRRLQDLEARHPEFADANSPTQRVGGRLVGPGARRLRAGVSPRSAPDDLVADPSAIAGAIPRHGAGGGERA